MEFIIGSIILGSLLFVGLLLRSSYERKQLEICPYDVASGKLNNDIKIVMLADLHSKEYGIDNELLLSEIKKECPDLLLIAGDMFVGNRDDNCQVALDLLRRLREVAPIYYGLGNHEDRIKEYVDELGVSKYNWYEEQVRDMNIHLLDNESMEIKVKDTNLRITGLTAPGEYFKKFNHSIMSTQVISDLVGDASINSYQILIAHNPVHLESYMDWGADLTVSGHLHGGIIRLPFIGGIITPQVKVLPRFSAGKYESRGKCGVISRGLGEHTVNIRFGNLPEISVINLKSKVRNT